MTQTQDEREYRKTATIRASRWLKNGDHPSDYANAVDGLENGEMRSWTGDEAKALGWEGQIVRYYRHPDDSGERLCEKCGGRMHDHGWIDTLEGGHIVCPGDWIATGVKGEHWPIKPDVFAASYVPVEAHLRSTSPARAATWEAACDEIFGSPAGEVGELVKELRFLADSRQQMGFDRAGAAMDNAAAMLERLAASDTEAMRLLRERYNELIYAVGNKYDGETRHETALRYIRQAETGGTEQAALAKGGAA